MADSFAAKCARAILKRKARSASEEELQKAFPGMSLKEFQGKLIEAVREGKLRVTNQRFHVPDLAPRWGDPVPTTGRKKKAPKADPRQAGLFDTENPR